MRSVTYMRSKEWTVSDISVVCYKHLNRDDSYLNLRVGNSGTVLIWSAFCLSTRKLEHCHSQMINGKLNQLSYFSKTSQSFTIYTEINFIHRVLGPTHFLDQNVVEYI